MLAEERNKSRITRKRLKDSDIKKIIKNHEYITIYYKGDKLVKKGVRLIETYVFGTGFRRGKKVSYKNRKYLRVYVIKDTEKDYFAKMKFRRKGGRRRSVSKTKRKPYWRLLRVDRITEWTVINRKFRVRSDYKPNDKMFGKIIENI